MKDYPKILKELNFFRVYDYIKEPDYKRPVVYFEYLCATKRDSDYILREFENEYFEVLSSKHKDTLDALGSGKITDELKATMTSVSAEVAKSYA